ncbi:MAG: cation:proton antiporter [Nanoarchaeota archaeon]|nr:cation:proton antiporter [Nanoarchaeota archaeon]MBU1005359.1 cation:proton antiporter [Nanoarchaeota archaeon]MBU1946085.1 cation:proton antiporter [Nanoarchaeota archaeon]
MSFITYLAPTIGSIFANSPIDKVFFEIGAIIIIATIFAFIADRLKQPLIPAYIITGLLIGPIFGLVTNKELISTLSEIGIAFLLFIVGLEMNLKKLKDVALVSYLGGTIRSLSMFTLGFIIALIIGFVKREAVYIGIIIAFSSTMIVVKLLSDKRELDTLHGRIIVGILLLEDLLAIIALSILTSLNGNSFTAILYALIKGVLLVLITSTTTKFLFPSIFKASARNQGLLFLTSTSACFLFSIIAYYLGFSIAIGAFLAGLSLASLPYSLMIIGKVTSLRDFFSTIFFVSLGMGLTLKSISSIIKPLIIILILVLFIKPIITMFICSFFGYKRRVSFLTSISLAQVSEFSFIIVAQGLIAGHVSESMFTLTVLVATITMVLTSYFIKFDNNLYTKFKSFLAPFEKLSENEGELEYLPKKSADVILCGQDRVGYSILDTIRKLKKNMLIVDYNPEIIKKLMKEKIPCIYGDISDSEILARLPLKRAEMIISTVPSSKVNSLLIRKIKESGSKAVIYVTSNSVEKALRLYDEGADYVILPHFLGGEHVSLLIEECKGNVNKIIKNKLDHIDELKHRQKIGHEHPRHHPNED